MSETLRHTISQNFITRTVYPSTLLLYRVAKEKSKQKAECIKEYALGTAIQDKSYEEIKEALLRKYLLGNGLTLRSFYRSVLTFLRTKLTRKEVLEISHAK